MNEEVPSVENAEQATDDQSLDNELRQVAEDIRTREQIEVASDRGTDFQVGDRVRIKGIADGPEGEIRFITTSTAVPRATVYWGKQEDKERESSVPLSQLEISVGTIKYGTEE